MELVIFCERVRSGGVVEEGLGRLGKRIDVKVLSLARTAVVAVPYKNGWGDCMKRRTAN